MGKAINYEFLLQIIKTLHKENIVVHPPGNSFSVVLQTYCDAPLQAEI